MTTADGLFLFLFFKVFYVCDDFLFIAFGQIVIIEDFTEIFDIIMAYLFAQICL